MLRPSQYLSKVDLLKIATEAWFAGWQRFNDASARQTLWRRWPLQRRLSPGRNSEGINTTQSLSGTRELLREFPKKLRFQLRRLTGEAEQSGEAGELVSSSAWVVASLSVLPTHWPWLLPWQLPWLWLSPLPSRSLLRWHSG
jgi:hypothetical protein